MITPEKKIDKIKKIIVRLLNSHKTMTGQYSMPYSTSDDDYADWKVELKLTKVVLWETEKYDRCKYSGSIYIDANVMIGFEGDWEEYGIEDLPSWVKDDIEDEILDDIEQFLPMVCVDITFN